MNLCAVYREAVNITPLILNLVQLYEVYEVLRDDSVPRCLERLRRGDLQKEASTSKHQPGININN